MTHEAKPYTAAEVEFIEDRSAHWLPRLRATVAALDAARAERDLAVAHDRQPYPTAEAYEKACALLEALRADLAAARAEVERLRLEARLHAGDVALTTASRDSLRQQRDKFDADLAAATRHVEALTEHGHDLDCPARPGYLPASSYPCRCGHAAARAWLAAQGQPAPAPSPDPWALLEAVVEGADGRRGGHGGWDDWTDALAAARAALAARGGGR